MPNITIKYKLPEERFEFDLANKAEKWYSVLWDLDQYLRNKLKYDEKLSKGENKAFEEIREHLHELMEENNISFEE